ncbi:MAG TPA: DoxX family protein [Gammaproteobacteria bacterium]|nr:DoxX family protein [Gammaproteobacteria bacterium]
MEDIGRLLLRLTLAILILFHGVSKVIHGIGWLEGMLQGAGVPAFVAYGVYIGEVVGPIMLLIGWYARIGALFIAINMAVAFLLVHLGQLFMLTDNGGWQLELQGMYLMTAVALALLGPGRFSINRR